LTAKQTRMLALTGDFLILAAFPFLGAANHEDGVNFKSFGRTFLPFASAWLGVGISMSALSVSTIRSVKRTYRWVPSAWLVAGVIAIVLRVIVFNRPFSLSFSIIAIVVISLLVVLWRLALAAVLCRGSASDNDRPNPGLLEHVEGRPL
jgi:hypothetical protein